MERRGNQQQPLGLCPKLFNFFLDNPAIRGLKRIASGFPTSHGLPQDPIDSVPPVHTETAREVAKKYMNSIVHIEFDAPCPAVKDDTTLAMAPKNDGLLSVHSSDDLNHNEEGKDQAHSYMHYDSIDATLSEPLEKNQLQVAFQEEKGGDRVAPSAPKKTVSIKEGAEEIPMPKKKRKLSKEMLKQSAELEKDAATRVPIPLKPILRSTSNINEKSDAFIKRRKEALRSISDIEARTRI